jgi:hypothetical protein
MPGAMGDRLGTGAGHGTALLDLVEVLGAAVALPDRPAGAALEHALHFGLVEHDFSGAADPGRDRAEQALRQGFFAGLQIAAPETGQQRPDPA